MHGTKDRVVPYKQSKLLKGALKRQGVKVHFVKVRRAGHGGERFDDPALMNKVVRFFNRYLQP
jgi:dipeptidyl aminopeptidase/acylaminoacyl peptidase